jgi:hypothetical protein
MLSSVYVQQWTEFFGDVDFYAELQQAVIAIPYWPESL